MDRPEEARYDEASSYPPQRASEKGLRLLAGVFAATFGTMCAIVVMALLGTAFFPVLYGVLGAVLVSFLLLRLAKTRRFSISEFVVGISGVCLLLAGACIPFWTRLERTPLSIKVSVKDAATKLPIARADIQLINRDGSESSDRESYYTDSKGECVIVRYVWGTIAESFAGESRSLRQSGWDVGANASGYFSARVSASSDAARTEENPGISVEVQLLKR